MKLWELLREAFADGVDSWEEVEQMMKNHAAEEEYARKEKVSPDNLRYARLASQYGSTQRRLAAWKKQAEEAATVDTAALQKEIRKWKQRYETARRDAAVDLAIVQAGGRNVKAIRALLNWNQIVFKADGTLEGLHLQALKASDGYLFTDADASMRRGTGLFSGGMSSDSRGIGQQFEDAVWGR